MPDQMIELTNEDTLSFLSAFMLLIQTWIQLPSLHDEETVIRSNVKDSDIKLAHAIAQELEASLHARPQIAQIALSHHVSRGKLSQLFKDVYGLSPRQYMTQLQIRHAKELLVHTSQSIESIADALDFSTVQHFSRQFKIREGMSPHAFRTKAKTKR